ncbi:glycosyltransferase [Halobellus marinus]|uniref:glycosyltransferase n=1 Tax=Halobellus TaxID=1073986 RepID=UPI0028A6E683|nr:glycosyltransferase [Halobellus sp. DFY28]
MARVAVVHNTLDFQGGADVVCLTVCSALQRDHTVTLYTLSETDPAALADRFGVDIDHEALTVRMPPFAGAIAGVLSSFAPLAGPQLALRSVLLGRYFARDASDFDLAVSTANELAFPIPSVQYVHYPQFHTHRLTHSDTEDASDGVGARILSRVAGPEDEALASPTTTLVANSAWTAGVVDRLYGVKPAVLHPPVDPIEGGRDWADREPGVVVVGRLAPDKRILDAIRVVDRVRARDHDIHLHIVGGAPRAYRQYVSRVETAATERSYVSVEVDVPRSRIETLLRTHKYGLNLKPREHFGMAVAEYVAAGMVAFAPDSGGQREVLDERTDRLFESVEEAVDLLSAAIEADDRPALPRDRFASRRFRESVRRIVNRAVA